MPKKTKVKLEIEVEVNGDKDSMSPEEFILHFFRKKHKAKVINVKKLDSEVIETPSKPNHKLRAKNAVKSLLIKASKGTPVTKVKFKTYPLNNRTYYSIYTSVERMDFYYDPTRSQLTQGHPYVSTIPSGEITFSLSDPDFVKNVHEFMKGLK